MRILSDFSERNSLTAIGFWRRSVCLLLLPLRRLLHINGTLFVQGIGFNDVSKVQEATTGLLLQRSCRRHLLGKLSLLHGALSK